ncbi:hypothetical protein GUITHDRAFT_103845 [Guillardia theta CCMP2712]|uniref:Uncharacterized protein n=2 Tax=Guillardia theta TaxID=55529 RepID=L1JRA1_GUITC|nr:hypothetical protein GUITHDRAFT_103845 [Guillardia theta CCMP2712]EKX50623.1 hypothetical protein GUITHDRAFT_103845 [Guillardia theta CCMP2712]|mmetsp:Transcript_20828/g.69510  ORF Transcript_20828/g.69510 Transcript_20828/m.69510 type:complete len:109 (+) Transcript_20828:500-826(+)|eukprot:XP_005837603.1 hypothetical protein GUITHDRAFT_103845 [Guillardia theta CCMP2712]
MSTLTGKRIADDVIDSPSKRIKQYFKEGFMRFGVQWANEEFAAASQQGTFSQASQDIMVPDVEPQPAQKEQAGTGMEVDTQKEAEWWEWWSKKWEQPAYVQVPNDLMR